MTGARTPAPLHIAPAGGAAPAPAVMAEVVTTVVATAEAVVREGVEVAGKEMVTHCRRRGGSRPCWMSLMPCCSRLMWPT